MQYTLYFNTSVIFDNHSRKIIIYMHIYIYIKTKEEEESASAKRADDFLVDGLPCISVVRITRNNRLLKLI